MTKREQIFIKFNGRCAYSGTILESDWQIDHVIPVVRINGKMIHQSNDCIENMVPVQKLINHYKHSYTLNDLRYLLSSLHIRLSKLPKNPRTEKGRKRKEYLLKVASYFCITENNPFSGVFYFETLK
jgi:5-methylcytosine-specific restriction endonuclease McrA